MANKTIYRGMCPKPENGENLRTRRFPKSTSSALAMFLHSPVAISAGEALTAVASQTAPSGATVNGGVTGSVVALLASDFSPVQNLAAADAGYVVVTIDPNQAYVMRVSTAAFADADAGKTYRLVATEPATAATATSYGDNFSERQLDGATEHASAEQIRVGGRVLPPIVANVNDAAVIGTEVYCTINSTHYFYGAS